MTKHVTGSMRALFQARPPIEYLAPPEKRRMPGYLGLGHLLSDIDKTHHQEVFEKPDTEPIEILTRPEIRNKKRKRREEENAEILNKKIKTWDPHQNPNATEEAYNTLFISRLNYDTTEDTIRKTISDSATVKSIKLVRGKEGKSRGYCFVELEDEAATKQAYHSLKGKQLDGKDIFVDVERGRTVSDWKPRRLGNTTGTPRFPKPKKQKISASAPSSSSSSSSSAYGAPRSNGRSGPPPPGRRGGDRSEGRFDRGSGGDRRGPPGGGRGPREDRNGGGRDDRFRHEYDDGPRGYGGGGGGYRR